MEKIINSLREKSRMLCVTFFFISAALLLFYYSLNNFDNMFSLLGNMIRMLFEVGLLVLVCVLLIVKKDSVAKILIVFISSYVVYSSIDANLARANFINDYVNTLYSIASFFYVSAACVLFTIVVIVIVNLLTKKANNLNIIFTLGIIFLSVLYVAGVFNFVYYAKENFKTVTYCNLLTNIFFPTAVFFGCLFVFAPKDNQIEG